MKRSEIFLVLECKRGLQYWTDARVLDERRLCGAILNNTQAPYLGRLV